MPKYYFWGVVLLLLGLVGCSELTKPAPPTPPPASPLRQLSPEEVQALSWEDDGSLEAISEAVQQSIRYYLRLKESHQFAYGDLTYSPKEMIASLNLFLNTIQSYQGTLRTQELQKKFLFFESKSPDEAPLFTGYYEPTLFGSVIPSERFSVPLYATPPDLTQANLGLFKEEWKGETIRGKLKGNQFVPYDSRDQISYQNSLEDRAEPIVYVENDIELFFLQIQGSGLIELQDKSIKRVNYANQNGHKYYAVGRLLIEEDKVPREKMSLQAIKEYLYANPDDVKRVLNTNPSYTFFREVNEGPLGNIEVPLTPERSMAMDHKLIPKGSLAFITTKVPTFQEDQLDRWNPMSRFMLVQDTGGAITGHGRADIFWGHGKSAELSAGHMNQTGRIFLIIARKEYLQSASDLISLLN